MITRPRVGTAAVLAGVALFGATPARAQIAISTDATRASVHYEGYQRSSVWVLAPVVRFERPTLTLAARGNFSLFESGNRSTDLVFAASLYPPSQRSWRPEISASAGVSRYLANTTAYGSASLRAHRIARAAGVWVGATATAVTGSTDILSGVRTEAGGWAREGPLTMSIAGALTSIAETDYFDLGIQARYTRGWLEVAGATGARAGGATLGPRDWADLSATLWLTRRLALVAGHGSYPSDPTQLSPGGRYTAISMRIATRPPAFREALARATGYPVPAIARPVVAGFEARRERDGRTRIRIRAADAQRVEIMGTFTDWEPVALERERGDRWEIVLPLERGTHHINVRVDGGEWGVPPGIGVAPDDFGGVVGLLVIA